MPYSSASAVAANCKNLLDGQVTWSTTTDPTLQQIKTWLSAGCSIVETELSSAGYDIPVGAGTSAYDRISDLEAIYAAARAEMSRTNITVGPGERTRGQMLMEMFWMDLDKLVDSDLTQAGVTKTGGGKIYTGGISVSTKQTYDTDEDRVPSRFRRGQFRWPGTQVPGGTTISADEDDQAK